MPNDKGAWMLGRAGWCNGRDVKPWVRSMGGMGRREARFLWWQWREDHAQLFVACCIQSAACAPAQCTTHPCPAPAPAQVIDITHQLAPAGQRNEVRYAGLFNGTQPLPEQKTGSIMLSANLVLWEA